MSDAQPGGDGRTDSEAAETGSERLEATNHELHSRIEDDGPGGRSGGQIHD